MGLLRYNVAITTVNFPLAFIAFFKIHIEPVNNQPPWLQSMGLQRVGHHWASNTHTHTHTHTHTRTVLSGFFLGIFCGIIFLHLVQYTGAFSIWIFSVDFTCGFYNCGVLYLPLLLFLWSGRLYQTIQKISEFWSCHEPY